MDDKPKFALGLSAARALWIGVAAGLFCASFLGGLTTEARYTFLADGAIASVVAFWIGQMPKDVVWTLAVAVIGSLLVAVTPVVR